MNKKTQLSLAAVLVGVILLLAGALPRRVRFMVTGALAALAAGSYVIENEVAKNRRG